MDLNKILVYTFGDYLSDDKASSWEGVKTQYNLRDVVQGVVIAQFPFGVFVDFGVGFPALLQVTQFEHARERSYDARSLSDYPPVGSRVTARIVNFVDRDRQIRLTQLMPHPDLDKLL